MEIHLKSRTVKYVSVTVAFLLVTTFLLYLFNMDKAIESLPEINYFDLLLGQIANTLIVLSLTSVLSSNFGQAYWVDIKETKLIKPFWTCFTGITVYLLNSIVLFHSDVCNWKICRCFVVCSFFNSSLNDSFFSNDQYLLRKGRD